MPETDAEGAVLYLHNPVQSKDPKALKLNPHACVSQPF